MDEKLVFGVRDRRTGQILGSFWRNETKLNTYIGDQMYLTGDFNEDRWQKLKINEEDVPQNCIIRD